MQSHYNAYSQLASSFTIRKETALGEVDWSPGRESSDIKPTHECETIEERAG